MQSTKLLKIITKENPTFSMSFENCDNTISSYKDYQIDYFNKIETGIIYDENGKLGIFFWKDDILIMHDYIDLDKNNLVINQQMVDGIPINVFYLHLKGKL